MKSTVQLVFDKNSLADFNTQCEIAIRNVGRGTKEATTEAAKEIIERSLEQVPVDTNTLAASAFYEVHRRADTSSSTWAYEATLGYGGNGDPINPKTGKAASYYMLIVHEDLYAVHNKGKAKFLEDPVHEYAEQKFERTVFKYAKESLSGMSD